MVAARSSRPPQGRAASALVTHAGAVRASTVDGRHAQIAKSSASGKRYSPRSEARIVIDGAMRDDGFICGWTFVPLVYQLRGLQERPRRDRCTDSETACKRLTVAKAPLLWVPYVRE
jgi:hypothetical protein